MVSIIAFSSSFLLIFIISTTNILTFIFHLSVPLIYNSINSFLFNTAMGVILGDTKLSEVAKTALTDSILHIKIVILVPDVHVVFIVRIPKLSDVKNAFEENMAIN